VDLALVLGAEVEVGAATVDPRLGEAARQRRQLGLSAACTASSGCTRP